MSFIPKGRGNYCSDILRRDLLGCYTVAHFSSQKVIFYSDIWITQPSVSYMLYSFILLIDTQQHVGFSNLYIVLHIFFLVCVKQKYWRCCSEKVLPREKKKKKKKSKDTNNLYLFKFLAGLLNAGESLELPCLW